MIKTEEEYKEALSIIEQLKEAEDPYNKIIGLIEDVRKYEEEHYSLGEPSLKDRIQFGIEQFGMEVKIGMKGYKTTIKYSVEDSCYNGKLEEISDLIMFEGQTIDEVCDAFIDAVNDYIELKKEVGK
jgi:hypothetical protein